MRAYFGHLKLAAEQGGEIATAAVPPPAALTLHPDPNPNPNPNPNQGGVPAALYASDITFAMPLPEADEALGEAAPTQTRSGVMDSLLRASLLRYSALIPGVNYPMVYLGGRNTFFCWHVEDNHLYATNYVVAGAPKVWYGVPLSHMGALEAAWQASLPKLFDAHPDICYYKTCMFSPHVLAAAGVPVYRAVHEAGSFMITTPGAYHAGFNTGFNIAESTNFAFCDWSASPTPTLTLTLTL